MKPVPTHGVREYGETTMVPWGRPNSASLTFIRPAASSWPGDVVLRQAGIPVTTDTRKANGQFLATTFGVRF
jgi:hypothetical protein